MALAIAAGFAAKAQAAEPLTMVVNLAADMPQACTVDTANPQALALGDLDPAQETQGQVQLAWVCTAGLAFSVTAKGAHDDASDRYLQSGGGDRLLYKVYWGDLSAPIPRENSPVSGVTAQGRMTQTILLKLPAATSPRTPGDYADTLTLTVTW